MARKRKTNDHGMGIPYYEVKALACGLLPRIQAFSRVGKGKGSLQSGKRSETLTRKWAK